MKKTVPLVVYVGDERRVVGTAEVEEDGSGGITATFTEIEDLPGLLPIDVRDFSIEPKDDQTEYNFRVI